MTRSATKIIQKIAGKNRNNSKVLSIVDLTRFLFIHSGARLYAYAQGCKNRIRLPAAPCHPAKTKIVFSISADLISLEQA